MIHAAISSSCFRDLKIETAAFDFDYGRENLRISLDSFWYYDILLYSALKDSSEVKVTEVCREEPVIPSSFHHGERVFYTGQRCIFPGGDILVYGAAGEIVGRSCIGQILSS